ncbi:MAG TPA: PASTA domain-containing protein [Solirubrobacterales bacterium]|nr:PASTA domain-containing protein [Solirubrobacterales bacterium]
MATLAIGVVPANAEEPEEWIFAGSFPQITSPAAPEEYKHRLDQLGPGRYAELIDEDEIVIFREGHEAIGWVHPDLAHDADGANVPTSLSLREGEWAVLTVHHREGNPLAGGAPFVYPVTGGAGWAGGYFVGVVEMNEPKPPASAAPSPPVPPTPCTVPSLHNLSLKSAKARLRAANCSIGQVRLAPTATEGKGKVVKQFRAAGTELAAGAPVAVKLGLR